MKFSEMDTPTRYAFLGQLTINIGILLVSISALLKMVNNGELPTSPLVPTPPTTGGKTETPKDSNIARNYFS